MSHLGSMENWVKVTRRKEVFVTFRKIIAVLTPFELKCPALLTSFLLIGQVQNLCTPLQFALSFLSEFTKSGQKPAYTLTIVRQIYSRLPDKFGNLLFSRT